jgi:hypothetical protein
MIPKGSNPVNRILRIFGAAGFIVAGILDLVWFLKNTGRLGPPDPGFSRSFEKITLILWPSSILLMATDGASTLVTVIGVSISLILNGLIYMAMGYLVLKLVRAFN